MDKLTVAQQIFMVFYAIIWGQIANVQPRWKAFQLPLFWKMPEVRRRVSLSFAVLTILPLIYFGYAMWVLGKLDACPAGMIAWILFALAAVVPAFAIFGFYRIWLGIVESWPRCFYAKLRESVPPEHRHVEPVYRSSCGESVSMPYVDLGANTGCCNITWGLGYVAVAMVWPLLAVLVSRTCP